VNGNTEREIVYCHFYFKYNVYMTNVLRRSDKSVTVPNKCSKIPTVSLSTLYNSCAKIACFSSQLNSGFFRAAESQIQATNSSCVSAFLLKTSLVTETSLVNQTDSNISNSANIQN